MADFDPRLLLNNLQAKEAEVAAALRRRDGLTIQAEPDVFDQIQDTLDRDLVVRNLDSSSVLLRGIREAIGRIESGQYGLCLRCDQPINPKRLTAIPWAALCLSCQEEADVEASDCDRWQATFRPGLEGRQSNNR